MIASKLHPLALLHGARQLLRERLFVASRPYFETSRRFAFQIPEGAPGTIEAWVPGLYIVVTFWMPRKSAAKV